MYMCQIVQLGKSVWQRCNLVDLTVPTDAPRVAHDMWNAILDDSWMNIVICGQLAQERLRFRCCWRFKFTKTGMTFLVALYIIFQVSSTIWSMGFQNGF